jgi:hypothetical protein
MFIVSVKRKWDASTRREALVDASPGSSARLRRHACCQQARCLRHARAGAQQHVRLRFVEDANALFAKRPQIRPAGSLRQSGASRWPIRIRSGSVLTTYSGLMSGNGPSSGATMLRAPRRMQDLTDEGAGPAA